MKKNSADFLKERQRLNEQLLAEGGLVTKRFFNLDEKAYQSGELSSKQKELLGLVASLVLRCDDCVSYHLIRCSQEAVTTAELIETLDIGLIAGGSIVISHYRRALDFWLSSFE
ncbi:carboxymuconolactone decarboxylase family protein [bacterium]|nr:carboxymuconolactone decarboxylase family protein [bacterium]